MNPEELCELIQKCDPENIELDQHVFERARRRNLDVSGLEDKILNCEFESVRGNNRSDPRFEYSFRVKIKLGNRLAEVPAYFNIPGTKVVVRSIWRGD